MSKQKEKIMREIRKMEIETYKDVKITAEKINLKRREKSEKRIYSSYANKDKIESFTNDIGLQTTMKRHIKNGSVLECA